MDDLDDLVLPPATKNALRAAHITTISALRQRRLAGTLGNIPGIGKLRDREIRRALDEHSHRSNRRDRCFVWLYLASGALFTLLVIAMGVWGFSKDSFSPHHYFLLKLYFPVATGIAAGSFTGAMAAQRSGRRRSLGVSATGGFAVWLITFLVVSFWKPHMHLSPADVQLLNQQLQARYGKDVQIEFVPDESGRVTKIILVGLTAGRRTEAIDFVRSRVPEGIPVEVEPGPDPGETEEPFEYVIDGVKHRGTRRVLTLDIGGGQTMEFVRVPKGSFLMGAADGERDADGNEKPRRTVEITTAFYLGKFEVTQAQFEAVTGQNPSRFRGPLLPVANLRWQHAVDFCAQVGRQTGRRVRLPSEAEWEYACRAGTATPYHFGSEFRRELANCDGRKKGDPAPPGKGGPVTAGSYPANAWGLHDMHGNVWEWCQDAYGPYLDVRGTRDPVRERKPGDRYVFRGGAWSNSDGVVCCRAAHRHFSAAGEADPAVGFRLVFRPD